MKRSKKDSNILLVKDDVGKSKPNTRKLPGDNFVFGKKEIRDLEDAGMGKSIRSRALNLQRDNLTYIRY